MKTPLSLIFVLSMSTVISCGAQGVFQGMGKKQNSGTQLQRQLFKTSQPMRGKSERNSPPPLQSRDWRSPPKMDWRRSPPRMMQQLGSNAGSPQRNLPDFAYSTKNRPGVLQRAAAGPRSGRQPSGQEQSGGCPKEAVPGEGQDELWGVNPDYYLKRKNGGDENDSPGGNEGEQGYGPMEAQEDPEGPPGDGGSPSDQPESPPTEQPDESSAEQPDDQPPSAYEQPSPSDDEEPGSQPEDEQPADDPLDMMMIPPWIEKHPGMYSYGRRRNPKAQSRNGRGKSDASLGTRSKLSEGSPTDDAQNGSDPWSESDPWADADPRSQNSDRPTNGNGRSGRNANGNGNANSGKCPCSSRKK